MKTLSFIAACFVALLSHAQTATSPAQFVVGGISGNQARTAICTMPSFSFNIEEAGGDQVNIQGNSLFLLFYDEPLIDGIGSVIIDTGNDASEAAGMRTFVGYYNLQGQRISQPQRGQLVIVCYSDGTSRKVLVK